MNGIHRFPTADPLTPVWTLLDVAVPDELAAPLAHQLTSVLIDGPWYADYGNEGTHTVIVPGWVFTYAAGDSEARRPPTATG